MLCIICSNLLTGKQSKFCSRKCHNKHGNYHHQSYLKQQERGLKRKRQLVEMAGGSCTVCGYSKNLAALSFHHTDPQEKSFQLDMRSLSNRKWSYIEQEFAKCELLCANCHLAHHNPTLLLDVARGS